MKKRVLFVDDEQNVLEGLRRTLRNMRHEWEMTFAESGEKALEILSNNVFDVVVSDMRMPGMDGCTLLTRVQKLYPHTARIILSGYSDREMILKSVRVAHQFLAKPCESENVQTTIARALALRELLADETLIRVVSRIEGLPSAPSIYQEITQELNSPNASLQKVTRIISKDVSMTAKILQLANSAFFGLSQHVNNMDRALTVLGFDTVVALVLTVQIFSAHNPSVPGFSIPALWDHSMTTASFAKAIAKEEKQERLGLEDAFMGGLLHDIGKLVLATNLSENYRQVMLLASDTDCPLWKAEQEVFGTTHAEVGAYLMGLWGIPDGIVEAIAFHHFPSSCPARGFGPLTAVHAGNALANAKPLGGKNETADSLDLDYLAGVGLSDQVLPWETVCKKFLQQGEARG
jgi:putative nucleotidyltransferase with HDIG domain